MRRLWGRATRGWPSPRSGSRRATAGAPRWRGRASASPGRTRPPARALEGWWRISREAPRRVVCGSRGAPRSRRRCPRLQDWPARRRARRRRVARRSAPARIAAEAAQGRRDAGRGPVAAEVATDATPAVVPHGGQRGWKRHPAGGAAGRAGCADRHQRRGFAQVGTERRSQCVGAASRNRRVHRPISTTCPAYITARRRHVCATTARSCVTNRSCRSGRARQQRGFDPDGDVECGRHGSSHRITRARATARWRSSRAGAYARARAVRLGAAHPDRGCRPCASAQRLLAGAPAAARLHHRRLGDLVARASPD